MDLKKEFFQEADKAISEFDSIYDFFKVAKRIITIDETKNASESAV